MIRAVQILVKKATIQPQSHHEAADIKWLRLSECNVTGTPKLADLLAEKQRTQSKRSRGVLIFRTKGSRNHDFILMQKDTKWSDLLMYSIVSQCVQRATILKRTKVFCCRTNRNYHFFFISSAHHSWNGKKMKNLSVDPLNPQKSLHWLSFCSAVLRHHMAMRSVVKGHHYNPHTRAQLSLEILLMMLHCCYPSTLVCISPYCWSWECCTAAILVLKYGFPHIDDLGNVALLQS